MVPPYHIDVTLADHISSDRHRFSLRLVSLSAGALYEDV